ncbi:MAG: prepilin peptidase [Candidatus Micrarchaeota archaeon]|nr:prepilin peptidase [Candidatus Micrarchaeota archaeon]
MSVFLFDASVLTMLDQLRLPAVLIIAIIYAGYDLFNKRDIPDTVAYASVLVGILFTAALDWNTMLYSLLIAIVVGALSYALYRVGQLGLGDGFEFVALSLIIPVQPIPIWLGAAQFGLPFILSIFIATGIAAILLVPIYYISRMKSADFKKVRKGITQNMMAKSAIMVLAYGSLFLFMTYSFGFSYLALAIIALIAIPSVVMIIFERQIMLQMIQRVYPNKVEAGDIIAVDLMRKEDVAFFKAKYPKFGKLATEEFVHKVIGVGRKLPVYKNAIPLALPTLIGVVASLLLGNLLLLII